MGMGIIVLFVAINIYHTYAERRGNPNNKYRGPGTAPDAHAIVIDDDYSVQTIAYTYSEVVYDDREGTYIAYTDSLDLVNWGEEYIIVAFRVEQLDIDSNLYYLIYRKGHSTVHSLRFV